MIAIANSGKKDLPKTKAVRDKNARTRRHMLSSFPLRLGWGGIWSSEGWSVPGNHWNRRFEWLAPPSSLQHNT